MMFLHRYQKALEDIKRYLQVDLKCLDIQAATIGALL